ncbi:Cell division transporter substrate-binding protein FtsY [Thiobacillus denitrificans ATCC 25259]|uniref:Signal recognition particle receptor FtsY n=1 Tax=Thiobacillus denitrificans (strain ATCC 25259 / T1) TaxID=292415 RepID=Q3SLS6_THIDA|nr:Cell division transporter substrate-binding protein FtsY [Thiobacillus denitrificans ATCC 25259]
MNFAHRSGAACTNDKIPQSVKLLCRPPRSVFSFFKSKPPSTETPADAQNDAADAQATDAAPDAPAAEATPPARVSWAQRLKQGLAKTRDRLGGQLAGLFGVGRKIDAELFEELETILITADIGVDATQALLDTLQKKVRRENLTEASELQTALKQALIDMLLPLQAPLDVKTHKPFILMLAGVNGAGKTTTIGKLAKLYQAQGLSVLLAAGDTFRAAAREQLQVWGERNGVTVVSQEKGDSAAVIFDAIQAARARNIDVVLADTAGRLPTQLHLMEEIRKVKRVIEKAIPGAPHEILLVLDANTGQNAVAQVKAFDDALGVSGLVLTKLDGTAKGGAIAAVAQARPLPVRYIGVGETVDDLRPFDARDFVEAVFAA